MRQKINILFSKSLFLVFCMCSLLSAVSVNGQENVQNSQERTIKGTVTDNQRDPIIGATVQVKGTAIGTITDLSGNYELKIPSNSKVLVFKYLGMKAAEFTLGAKNRIDLQMEPNDIALNDVVVIGYGETQRKDLTGSVSSMKSEDLAKNLSSDFVQSMQGRLAGVKITSESGEPGAGVDVKIRGANSIFAGTAPLYVIDGMLIDVNESEVATSSVGGSSSFNPLSSLNPNDIESIDILKDASATAIYGSRGANGVIIVTTKTGASAKGKTEINLNTYYGVSQKTKTIKMLNGQEYIDYKYARNKFDPTYGVDTNGDGIVDAPLSADGFEQYNWQDLLLRTGSVQNYDLSFNTSKDKINISTSLGYFKQEGLIINNDYHKYSGRLKVDYEVNDKLSIGASATYGKTLSEGAVSSGGGEGSYTGLVQAIYTERPIKLFSSTEGDEDYPNGYVSLATMATNAFKETTMNRFLGNAYLNYKIDPTLSFRVSGSTNTSNSKLQEFYGKETTWGRKDLGRATIMNVETNSYTSGARFNYKNRFLKKHSVDAMLGAEINAYHYERAKIVGKKFEEETTGVYDISKAGVIDKPESYISQVNRLSYFGRVAYSYMYRYYLTATMRADGSSNFQDGNKFGYFPSASVAWRVNEEKWMKRFSFLDNLKLRASAGITGNDRISSYGAYAGYGPNYYAAGGSAVLGLSPTSPGNKNLKWEATTQYDMGVDLGLFNHRINLTADIYLKDTKDMLLKATVGGQTGFVEQWQNIGKIRNKGFEMTLNTHNIETKDFKWNTSFNFDMNRNKIMSLGDENFIPVTIGNGYLTDVARVTVGKPIGTGYGYVFDGNYQINDFTWKHKTSGAEADPSTINSSNIDSYNYTLKDDVVSIANVAVKPGDRKYKDLKIDGVIDENDRTEISNSNPNFSWGLGNEFSYKNFDFYVFFEGVQGFEIMNAFTDMVEAGSKGSNSYNLTQEYWNNRWTPENPTNKYASVTNSTNDFVSSYYVEDASYVRLKTITLGYNFEKSLLKKLKIAAARVYFTVDNVYLWTDYSGMDPDIKSVTPLFSGYDRLSYPRARSYTFGLNLTF